MPRELWAKIAVEIVRDPKLLARAPWERWLWLGLICLTKEFGKEGVLRATDVSTLCVTLNLRVASTKVVEALAAFERSGMIRILHGGDIELVHFVKRQAPRKDNPEAVAERQRRWRARHKKSNGSNGAVTGESTRDISSDRPVTRNAEEEEEEEEEEDPAAEVDRISVDGPGKSPPPPLPPPSTFSDYLHATWPALQSPEQIAAAWREHWPSLNLLSEAKAARAYELETGKQHENPGSYLRGWFRRASVPQSSPERDYTKRAMPTAAETSKREDERERSWREETARGNGPKAAESRAWLRARWPDKYPPADDDRWKALA